MAGPSASGAESSTESSVEGTESALSPSSEQRDQGTHDPDERTLRYKRVRWTSEKHRNMRRAGLYKRQDVRCPTLAGFSTYLQVTLGVRRYRQEVENVARFLYFVNPESTDLDWIRDIEKVHAFFTQLRDQLLSEQTVLNYLKGVRRILRYQIRATNLPVHRPRLFQSCRHLCLVIDDLQKGLSKGVSREVVRKWYLSPDKASAMPDQCRQLHQVAKPNFLKNVQTAMNVNQLGLMLSKLSIICRPCLF
ncbi:uncharacterized protein LOC130297006 isoform X2 [Hyla sarda]|nr:uncharacterized protein LOC130297006 isoform X2 [Hyla sarda]XP_056405120.1 uncharacterized protein LOC130297006 isoform X2 [Hyla sarda]XP_056405121.1 uncharacterized protein LOC130297006 isoform X2 [Hyla sarda]XP_056405122.1 uncharacterized protein LOC130297006 isoform X2 [Hyla sarda]